MALAYISVFALVLALSLALRLASVFRLTIPLLYALIAPTLFHGWFTAHPALANGIGWALLGLTALSWVVSLVRKTRELVAARRDDRFATELFLRRTELAEANGEDSISTAGLYRKQLWT